MAYKINYGPARRIQKTGRGKRHRLLVWILVVVVLLGFYASGLRDKLVYWLLPGDPEVTAAALETMVQQIGTGENVGDAFSCFCREIIDHADIPE